MAALASAGFGDAARATTAAIDPGFGVEGLVSIDLPGDQGSEGRAAVTDAAGYLYLAGVSQIDAVSRCTIAKLDADGELEPDFADAGVFVSDLGDTEMLDTCQSLVIDGDGNLFAAGTTYIDGHGSSSVLVIGVAPDGQLLDAFGDNGKVVVDLPDTGGDYSAALAIDAESNLYVAGAADTLSDAGFDALVIKLDHSGHPVSSFGDDGVALISLGGPWDAVTDIAIDAAGHAVLAGTTNYGQPSDFVAARLTSGGELDDGFGTNGLATLDIDTYDTPYGLALDASGNAYALVMATRDAPGRDVAIVKLDASGQRVTGFGVGGIAHFNWGLNGIASAIGFGPGGSLYVSGLLQSNASVVAAVAAVDPVDGLPVADFADNGVFTHAFNPELGVAAQCFDNVGRLYLAGSIGGDFAATRILLGSSDVILANGFDP